MKARELLTIELCCCDMILMCYVRTSASIALRSMPPRKKLVKQFRLNDSSFVKLNLNCARPTKTTLCYLVQSPTITGGCIVSFVLSFSMKQFHGVRPHRSGFQCQSPRSRLFGLRRSHVRARGFITHCRAYDTHNPAG